MKSSLSDRFSKFLCALDLHDYTFSFEDPTIKEVFDIWFCTRCVILHKDHVERLKKFFRIEEIK